MSKFIKLYALASYVLTFVFFLGFISPASAVDPPWMPYQIPDVAPPYKALPISAERYPRLIDLRGKGSDFLMRKKNTDNNWMGAFTTSNIWVQVGFSKSYKQSSKTFDQINYSNITSQNLTDYSSAFWNISHPMTGETNSTGYFSITPAENNNQTLHWFDNPGWCYFEKNFRLQVKIDTRNTSGSIYHTATDHTPKGSKIPMVALEEENGHTPFPHGDYNFCIGYNVHDDNIMRLDRLSMAGPDSPKPFVHFPLDSAHKACDMDQQFCGTEHLIQYGKDRFNEPGKAAYFTDSLLSRINMRKDVYDTMITGGQFTMAFWIALDPTKIGSQTTDVPVQENLWYSTVWGKNSFNRASFGLSINATGGSNLPPHQASGLSTGHLALNRFTNIGGKAIDWRHWLPAPTRLTKQSHPWTYIVMVYDEYKIQIYTYNPWDYLYGQQVHDRLALTRYSYFRNEKSTLESVTSWGLGRPQAMASRTFSPILAMDDMSLFSTALKEDAVRELINSAIMGETPSDAEHTTSNINIVNDIYGNYDQSWMLKDPSNNIIYQNTQPQASYSHTELLMPGQCYQIVVNDSFGDGWASGGGSVNITHQGKQIVNFGDSSTWDSKIFPFCMPVDTNINIVNDIYGNYDQSWMLKDSSNNIIYQNTEPQASYNHTELLMPGQCYQIVINDSFGDGWASGGGSVNITHQGKQIANFSDSSSWANKTFPFCMPVDTNINIVNDIFGNYDQSWMLKDSSNNIIYQNTQPQASYSYSTPVLLIDQCYQITVSDSYGDGWANGGGSINVNRNGAQLLNFSDNTSWSNKTVSFCI